MKTVFSKNNTKWFLIFIAIFFVKLSFSMFYGLYFLEYLKYGDTYFYYELALEKHHLMQIDFSHYISQSVLDYQNKKFGFTVLLFSDIVTFLMIIFSSNYWFLSAGFALISSFCVYLLIKKVNFLFNIQLYWLIFIFAFLPNNIFWCSGLAKETLIYSTLCLVILFYLNLKNEPISFKLSFILNLLGLILMVLFFYLFRHFWCILLIGFFSICFIANQISKQVQKESIWFKILILSSIFTIIVECFLPQYGSQYLVDWIEGTYFKALSACNNASFIDILIQPKSLKQDIILNLPKALYEGMFGFGLFSFPILTLSQKLSIITNSFLFILVFWGIIKNKNWEFWQICVISYVLTCIAFTAISIPNYGAIERYKSTLIPILLFSLFVKKFKQAKT